MSENSAVSYLSAKKFYVLVAIGLIVFAGGTLFAYSANEHLKAEKLPAEELHKQERIYAAAKIVSMVGFIIALIPSVQILQNAIQNERVKASGKANADIKKEKDESEDE